MYWNIAILQPLPVGLKKNNTSLNFSTSLCIYLFRFKYFIEFIAVTLVNKIIQILYTSSVHSIVCSSLEDKSPSITSYPCLYEAVSTFAFNWYE